MARVALAVLSLVACACLLELLAWSAGVEPLSRGRARTGIIRANLRYADPWEDCAPEKLAAPGRKLILALGGSSVVGYPEQVPFPARLREALDRRHPGEFAVRNLGRSGKDSIYVRRCVERAIDASPRVLILYTGHNDVGNWGLADPGKMIFLEEHAWLLDLRDALEHSRAFSALVHLVGGRVWREPGVAQDPAARRVILEKFRENLEAVVDLAGDRGSQVILVTLVSNLLEYPRGDAARSALGVPQFRGPFEAGKRLQQEGRTALALRELKRARDALPQGRAFSEQNDVLREVARRHPQVRLVDFEKVLDRVGAREGIGCNFFGGPTYCDQLHPNHRTHELLAASILPMIERMTLH